MHRKVPIHPPVAALARACSTVYRMDAVAEFWAQGYTVEAWITGKGTQVAVIRRPSQWRALVFRGTQLTSGSLGERTRDLLRNLRLANLRSGQWPEVILGRAHHGYVSALRAVYKPLREAVTANSDLPLHVSGHSLGGAVATLYAAAAPDDAESLVTFGAPKAGSADALNAISAGVHRYAFRLDWATAWPPSLTLSHPDDGLRRVDWPGPFWVLYRHDVDRYAKAVS